MRPNAPAPLQCSTFRVKLLDTEDQIDPWLKGEDIPLLWDRKDIERDAKQTLGPHPSP